MKRRGSKLFFTTVEVPGASLQNQCQDSKADIVCQRDREIIQEPWVFSHSKSAALNGSVRKSMSCAVRSQRLIQVI